MPDASRSWYVLTTFRGYEYEVKKNLEHRKITLNATDRIFRVEVPSSAKGPIGRRARLLQLSAKRGYVLVEMSEDDALWQIVRHTPGVLDMEKLDL